MKIIKRIYIAILLAGSLVACQDDLPQLGELLSKDELEYAITQNPEDPNMVILESFTPDVIPQWIIPGGRSTKQKDTLLLPFAGSYKFVYGVQGGAGYVSADTFRLEITTFNLTYVSDPLWEALTGGVGNEKTWLLDLDADGVSKYFLGPMYFYGTDNGWDGDCLVEDGDCWSWTADWPGNNWIADVGDYGEMTFSLNQGAYLTSNNQMIPSRGLESGTFFLDADNLELTSSNATPLHSPNYESCVVSWESARVFSLTEDYMQLGFLRKASCDGAALLVFNYISKEYSDNWEPVEVVPTEDEGFNPVFESGELLEMLTGGKSSAREWRLDGEGNPIDWLTSGIGWTSVPSDSYNWGWNDDWAAASGNSWIRFDQFNETQTYTLSQNGVVTSSTFIIDEETNEISLGDTNTLITDGGNGSWMNPGSTITVVKAFPENYEEKGIWFGTSYDEDKDEWFVFHYILP